ncbi:XrtA-associated tyrosine autokinase [Azohydromonas caseinilytica]|uniref:non-specific protein-tyrosine kinase n=1 Tax=Azohydromonas caseinilytica TaxID=2728836 RepID=A0A848FHL9_9BURK|nr:XrtA-associated tyrosine autokinase [Azohydromonas caseinilytica]NML18978.1 AAA family ATPase [Azohydromonas caseinilytica]
MNIIELATQRLQELSQTGVEMPPSAVGTGKSEQRIGTIPTSSHQTAIRQAAHHESEPARLRAADAADGKSHRISRQSETVTLDIERLEQAGVLVATRSRSTMAEEFRHIKRPLLANARKLPRTAGDRSPLIMVTSALPGEGKTFCSINLAVSLAIEVDMSVLLVDADVVRCSLMRTLGLQPRKGLLDVLTDSTLDLSDVLLKTNVPKLSVLPAGTGNVRSTELLASDAMDQLLGELASRYPDRLVVFDTTPLLLTSEAKVLASRMGQVVVVVEESKTPYPLLEQAFAAVEDCLVVMSILNKGRKTGPDYGSYYG